MQECQKCGACCKEKVFLARTQQILTIWTCPYLNENNLCKIYEQRDYMKPKWCNTIKELEIKNKLNTLPKECSYYRGG